MKKRVLCILLTLVIAAAAGGLLLGWFQGQELYVLMYHSVAPDGTDCGDWTVTQSRFREQMQWLREHGYTTVLPSELAAGDRLPKKAVLISFDDGYADNYRLAYPVLREFGHKAVVSVVTGYIGTREEFMTWDMCRQMEESGLVEIGSHTHDSHRYPGVQRREGETRKDYEKRILADIGRSAALLEQELGHRPVFFAYPHGIADEWAADYVQERFELSVVTLSGVNKLKDGSHGLLRYNINDRSDLSGLLPA